MQAQFKKTRSIASIHNDILKEKKRELVKEVLEKTPEIQADKVMTNFVRTVNQMKFKDRLALVWRIIRRKL